MLRVAIPCVVAFWLALVGGAASAHPMGKYFPVHKTELTLEHGRAVLDYTVLIPTDWIVAELKDHGGEADDFTADKLRELRESVLLRQDGALLRWTELPLDEETGLGNRSNFQYRLLLAAELADAPPSFELTLTSYPDTHSFFNHTLRADPSFEVVESSLFRIEEGRARFDENGQWRAEDRLREVTVELAHGGGLRALTLGDEPLLLGDLVIGDAWEGLDEGRLAPWLGAVLVGVATLLGLLGGLAGPTATAALGRGVPVVLATLALVTFGSEHLAASTGGLAVGNGVAAGICGVVGAWRWRRSWPDGGLLGLGIGLAAVSCHDLGLSLLLLESFTLGLLAGSLRVALQGAPKTGGLLTGWLGAVGLVFVALILGLRGWGVLTEQLNTLTG